jgi:catechol 2,3-dioxygenase-like lactoylglutathione lyase family enzyme
VSEPLVKLGPISHIGLVVEDAEKAAAFWSRTFGVGPFEIREYDMSAAPYFLVDGKPARPRFKAAIAFSGEVFIELVEVLEGETVHTQFLRRHGEGLQHLAFSVDNAAEIIARLKSEGIEPVLDYEFDLEFNGQPVHVHEAYLNTAKFLGGTTIQLLEMKPRKD